MNPGRPDAPRTHWLVALVETVLGLALAATPVALWIAWTPALLGAVLAGCIVCALVLVWIQRWDAAALAAVETPRPQVDERFFAEMHRIAPLVYHHRLREPARFRRAMGRVRRLLGAL